MTTFTIFGSGAMATAIAGVLTEGGATVEHIGSSDTDAVVNGEVVILAVPYPALEQIAAQYRDKLADKVVVDITNPLDFETFDSLVVPTDSSAASELAAALTAPPCSLPATTTPPSRPWPQPCRPAGSTPLTPVR